MSEHEAVVTGWGIVSPLGLDVPEFQRRMFGGESAVRDVRGNWVHETFPVPFAALVARDRLGQPAILARPPEQTPDSWRFAGLATEQALAGLEPGLPIDAVVYATADGTHFELIRDSFRATSLDAFDWAQTRSESALDVICDIVERHTGHGVPRIDRVSINNACVSSNQALATALRRIRKGQWRRVLVGGVDARCDANNLMNFHMLGALTTADVPAAQASRPFSRDRQGFVRGEGAATLLLEAPSTAQARNAGVLGRVTGAASSSDAHRLTDGRPDGAAVSYAMVAALRDARVSTARVSAISAHGTSTRMNDRLETLAIRSVFGERASQVPVTSLKSQLGHATVAAGAIEAVACLAMLQQQTLAPTINYHQPDPECDLDYVPNLARPAELDVMLSNNFGFGGQNACVVFQR